MWLRNALTLLVISLMISVSTSCNSEKSRQLNIKKGEILFQSSGCMVCHSLNGQSLYGPPLNSLHNQITVIRDRREQTIIPGREYVIRSIKDPDYEKLKGYEGKKMPVPALTDEQVNAITDYLLFVNEKSLR